MKKIHFKVWLDQIYDRHKRTFELGLVGTQFRQSHEDSTEFDNDLTIVGRDAGGQIPIPGKWVADFSHSKGTRALIHLFFGAHSVQTPSRCRFGAAMTKELSLGHALNEQRLKRNQEPGWLPKMFLPELHQSKTYTHDELRSKLGYLLQLQVNSVNLTPVWDQVDTFEAFLQYGEIAPNRNSIDVGMYRELAKMVALGYSFEVYLALHDACLEFTAALPEAGTEKRRKATIQSDLDALLYDLKIDDFRPKSINWQESDGVMRFTIPMSGVSGAKAFRRYIRNELLLTDVAVKLISMAKKGTRQTAEILAWTAPSPEEPEAEGAVMWPAARTGRNPGG